MKPRKEKSQKRKVKSHWALRLGYNMGRGV